MNTNQHTPVNSSATVANNYLARSLRQLQSTTFLHCMEHSRKTINTSPPVYTGMTALRLAGIETPLCSRFEAMKFQVLYIGEPTKRSGRKDTSYLKCPPSLTGIAHLTWTHDNITIVYTHPLMTWALLAPYLTQIEVIVLADAILRASSGSMTVANISRFLDGADAFPSRRKCIDALVFLDAVTDSTMECRCTLVMCDMDCRSRSNTGRYSFRSWLTRQQSISHTPNNGSSSNTMETRIAATNDNTDGMNARGRLCGRWDIQSSSSLPMIY